MRVSRTILALIAFVALITAAELNAVNSETPPSATARLPLSTDQVVDNLVRRNQERAQALLRRRGCSASFTKDCRQIALLR